MGWQADPWTNPELKLPRRGPARGVLRSGRSRIVTALVLTAGAYAAYTLIGGELGLARLFALRREEARLGEEIAVERERVAALEGQINNLKRTRENEARTKFRMARPNELIYEVVEGEADSVASGSEAPPPEAGEPERAPGDRP